MDTSPIFYLDLIISINAFWFLYLICRVVRKKLEAVDIWTGAIQCVVAGVMLFQASMYLTGVASLGVLLIYGFGLPQILLQQKLFKQLEHQMFLDLLNNPEESTDDDIKDDVAEDKE